MPLTRKDLLGLIQNVLEAKFGLMLEIDSIESLKSLLPGLANRRLGTLEELNVLYLECRRKKQMAAWLSPPVKMRKPYKVGRRSGRKISVEEILKRRSNGDSVRSIAAAAGVTVQSIYKDLAKGKTL